MFASLLARRDFLRAVGAVGVSCVAAAASADENPALHEPIHRVAKANSNPPPAGHGRRQASPRPRRWTSPPELL